MIIQEIILENFRQYKLKSSIKFSTDVNKNVTVITGDNTCGKTTLVQAFIWCLYGTSEFKDRSIINAEVFDELLSSPTGTIKTCSVSLLLTHNNLDYKIVRLEKYSYNSNGKLEVDQSFKIYEIEDGNAKPLDDDKLENTIEKILPEKLSSYFFFWGEKIEKLTERKELESAVKHFLGLDTINEAIRHLEMAIKKIRNSLTENTTDSEIQNYQKRINNYNLEIKKWKDEKESVQRNLDYYGEKKNSIMNDLFSNESQILKSRQDEFKNKSMLLEQRKNELEKAKQDFFKLFNDEKNYVYYYAAEMEKSAIEVLQNNPEPVVGWKYIDSNAINEIIKKGICICGSEICDGSNEYNYLKEQLKLVSPNAIGGIINGFIEDASRKKCFNEQFYETMHKKYQEISDIFDEIVELEYIVSNLEHVIKGKSDVSQKYNELKDVERKINHYMQEKGKLDAYIDKNMKNIKICENKIDALAEQNRRHNMVLRQKGYAESLLKIFEDDYKQNETTIKQKLNQHVNENFSQVYSGNRKIEIDDKYNAIPYNLVGNKWISSETSPGLETVKNFAFIVGLVQCAKDKIIGEDGEVEANSNSYPLVLDAPFSQADEKHIPQISKLISDNAEQIILIVMKKDWNYAEKILQPKVGAFYDLEKESETCTRVMEVNIYD